MAEVGFHFNIVLFMYRLGDLALPIAEIMLSAPVSLSFRLSAQMPL